MAKGSLSVVVHSVSVWLEAIVGQSAGGQCALVWRIRNGSKREARNNVQAGLFGASANRRSSHFPLALSSWASVTAR